MRTTTPALPFQLSPDLKEDPWLPWLIEHAHPDLWMPRVPIAVIERIRRRFQGQKKTTLVNLWIGIRRLLVLYIKTGRNDFSVRDIASISGVSRSRLCGDKGFIQDLLDVGVIGVTVPAEPEVPGIQSGATKYQARTRYSIDMAALEAESLVLLRQMFSSQESVPDRDSDGGQRSLLDLLAASDKASNLQGLHTTAPVSLGTDGPPVFEAKRGELVTSGATMMLTQTSAVSPYTVIVSDETIESGTRCDQEAPYETATALFASEVGRYMPAVAPTRVISVTNGTCGRSDSGSDRSAKGANEPATVPHDAVGMQGIGMDRRGGGATGTLSREEAISIVYSTLEQALAPAMERMLGNIAQKQNTSSAQTDSNGSTDHPAPAAPEGEPQLTIGLREAWTLYKGSPDPLDLHRLALLPHRFDAPSGGFGAYWLTRAILMLSERPVPVTLPYLRGVLDRMQRTGDWSTTQLEAPPEECETTQPGSLRQRQPAPTVAPAANPSRPAPPPPPVATPQHPTLAALYRCAPPGLQLTVEQERRLVERVRDQELWSTVCANWRAEGHKFSNSDNVLDRYCTMETRRVAEQPAASDGLSKLEREIYALPGLSDEERAVHCATLMSFPVDDRRRYVEDLRQRLVSEPEGSHP